MPEETNAAVPQAGAESETEAAPAAGDLEAMLERAQASYEQSIQAPAAPDAAEEDEGDRAEAVSEESVSESADEQSASQEASNPEGATAEERPLSRRQRAEAERQREIDQAVQRALEAERQAREAQARLAEQQQADDALFERYAQRLGTAEERERLVGIVARGKPAEDTAEQAEAREQARVRLAEIDAAREAHRDAETYIRAEVRTALSAEYATARALPGVDAAAFDRVQSLAEAFKLVHESAVKATEARLKGQLARQESDAQARLARAAGRYAPSTAEGGRATAGQGTRPSWLGPDGLPTDEAQERWARGERPY
jgi:hypothetical protein